MSAPKTEFQTETLPETRQGWKHPLLPLDKLIRLFRTTRGNVQEEIFVAPDFVVRYVGEQRVSCCVVTFYSLTNFSALDRPGFAEDFFLRQGIDAIHVINRTNAWYQYPELPSALQKIKDRLSGYARIFTYGSSMGGYAAFRFAGAIGAQVAIALSAQYSFLARRVPFENRWRALRRNVEPIVEAAFLPGNASCR